MHDRSPDKETYKLSQKYLIQIRMYIVLTCNNLIATTRKPTRFIFIISIVFYSIFHFWICIIEESAFVPHGHQSHKLIYIKNKIRPSSSNIIYFYSQFNLFCAIPQCYHIAIVGLPNKDIESGIKNTELKSSI
jgi:hypothetical protein